MSNPMSNQLPDRFAVPYLLTVRPLRGGRDLALLVNNEREQAMGRILDPSAEPVAVPFPVGIGAALTEDARWVLELHDDNGSEVGHLVARPVDGGPAIDLTPDRPAYVLRGLSVSADGSAVLITAVDEDGFHAVLIPAAPWGEPRVIFSSRQEAWYGNLSADARYASIDTTDHAPGVRRPAVTVIECATGAVVAVLDDLPAGPVRAVCFSERPGDPRLLANTERGGFSRPCVWNPLTGERLDFELADRAGEVVPLDWHAGTGRILAVHVDGGVHTALQVDERGGTAVVLSDEPGSYADPDVADVYPYIAKSYFAPDGTARLVHSRWDLPRHIVQVGEPPVELVAPADVPAGVRFSSNLVESADGTLVQLWLGLPADGAPRATVLEVHGGPNLVTVDGYSPSAQAWLDEGFAYASLNYRGSVTFGRAFREGFWHAAGDREIEDIEAAVTWLRTRGLAAAESTFITGPSYGGHLTLLSAGRLPDLFAGGLAHVAMADWAAAFEDMNPAVRGVWKQFIGGTPSEMAQRIERYSAINFVSQVRASVWLNQGITDTRTPAAQAQRYADALRSTGGDVVIEWFDGGHEPTGLAGMEHDQLRMVELANRRLAGQRWDHR